MDKKCLTCKEVKPLSEFNRNKKNSKDGRRSMCKECRRPRTSAYKTKKMEKRKKIVDAIKLEKGCKVCGYNKYAAALHFHHRDPEEKMFTISTHLLDAMSRILIEIDKCDVMCANCHALVEHDHSSKSTWDTKKI